ncbi:multiple sugar transport system substrate-binding protein [Paenibacillus sp. UNCCL117]|uniref:extracellular solute-binding protein n=1 Tax=unclassified Paenibacillus TaxID=185978 RepID=UPI000880CE20|nr:MULTISPECIES: extracellular solute-binding protein [unclassified Paenibacillus]SDD12298.1 multiple sugar transport system substrate-binding protein [Paenibacillus sp. cl123]SFW33764.1 multiple sugar transport system substrate-binding protein [Paenibacillus sp. UNCCL117]
MPKIDRKTFQYRSNQLLAHIRTKVADKSLKPGDFIPAETALAQEFQLSKNSVRLALEKLVEEGLIVKIPRVGTQVAPQRERTVIRLGLYPSLYEEVKLKRLIELFQERHPHIQVEALEISYYSPDKIRQLLQLGVIDAVTLNHPDYLHFRDRGLLELLEPLTAHPETYDFLNGLFPDGKGRLAVKPFIFSPVILCYNQNHFRENRVFEPDSSWTWQDLREALRRLAGPNRYGLFFHLSSTNRWPIFLLQNEARFVRGRDGDGMIRPEDPAMLDSLPVIRDLIHEEGLFPLVMSFGLHDVEQLFKQQKVSVILTTYYRLNQLADAGFPFDIAQLPKFKNRDTLLLCTGIALNAQSPRKEAAQRFIDFLTSEEVQSLIRRQTFTLPANKWIAELERPEALQTPSRLEIYREMIPHFTTHDRLQLTIKEIELLGDCQEQYFSKLVDTEELIHVFNKQLADAQVTSM